MLNIKTISFFGDSLFASPKRWATISDTQKQHNFVLSANYSKNQYLEIEKTLSKLLHE